MPPFRYLTSSINLTGTFIDCHAQLGDAAVEFRKYLKLVPSGAAFNHLKDYIDLFLTGHVVSGLGVR